MKKYIILIPIVLLLSCSKGMVTFTVKDSVETTIENVLPISIPFNIPIPAITTTATEEFENNNTTPEMVQEVLIQELIISLINSNEDFSMLKAVHIFIMKSDGTDRLEVAYFDDIDSNANSLSLELLNTNLVAYLREETYKIDVEVTLKEIVAQDIDIKIDMEFKVLADVLR